MPFTDRRVPVNSQPTRHHGELRGTAPHETTEQRESWLTWALVQIMDGATSNRLNRKAS